MSLVVGKKKIADQQGKNKNQRPTLLSLKEDVNFFGDMQTPDSNLIFFHSCIKLFNILVIFLHFEVNLVFKIDHLQQECLFDLL